MKSLTGIFPPVTTPFNSDGELLFDAWNKNFEKWSRAGLHGYTVLGSNGESPYLSDEEKLLLVRQARQRIPANKTMIVGAGKESTRLCLQFVRQVADLGADYGLIGTPAYFKSSMTEAALFAHYWTIADESPIPILVYNVPQFTGITASTSLVAKLSAHENIAGIKDSSGNLSFQGQVRSCTHDGFHILGGSAQTLLPSLIQGASGGIIAAACAVPAIAIELYEMFRSGNWQAAAAVQARLSSLAAVTSQLGVAGLKAAMDLLGFYGGPPRLPLLPVDEAQKATVESIFRAAGVLEAAQGL